MHVKQDDLPDLLLTEGWNGPVPLNGDLDPNKVGVVGQEVEVVHAEQLDKIVNIQLAVLHTFWLHCILWHLLGRQIFLFPNGKLFHVPLFPSGESAISSTAHKERRDWEESSVFRIWLELVSPISPTIARYCQVTLIIVI